MVSETTKIVPDLLHQFFTGTTSDIQRASTDYLKQIHVLFPDVLF